MSDTPPRPIDRERPRTRRAWFVLGVCASLTAVGAAVLWIVGELPFEAASAAIVATVIWWGAGLYGMEKMVGLVSPDVGDSSADLDA